MRLALVALISIWEGLTGWPPLPSPGASPGPIRYCICSVNAQHKTLGVLSKISTLIKMWSFVSLFFMCDFMLQVSHNKMLRG